ncbi:MAG: helix-turn-helix domain-containing protein [Halopenitus sp.]
MTEQTTAYERKQRRREVVRLRAQGYSVEEMAEELATSESTISRDLDRINSELQKLDDPDVLKKEIRRGVNTLMEHEYEDLRRADREADEKAKHRAKTSFRQTLDLLQDMEEEFTGGVDRSTDDWLQQQDEEVREALSNAAKGEVNQILES